MSAPSSAIDAHYCAYNRSKDPRLSCGGFAQLGEGGAEGDGFAAARWASHRLCASQLQAEADKALDSLNVATFREISGFITTGSRQLQSAWEPQDAAVSAEHGARHVRAPPYAELPAAVIHSVAADHALQMRQLLRHVHAHCSPHVAVLRSRECSSLTAGIKSLVVQMLGPDTHTGAACAFDLAVLSGWHADMLAKKGAAAARAPAYGSPPGSSNGREHSPRTQAEGRAGVASARQAASSARASRGSEPPFVVLIEDAEHFAPGLLDDLVHACATARSVDGLSPLPIAFILPLLSSAPDGLGGLGVLLRRSALLRIRTQCFSLGSTELSVERVATRLLLATQLPCPSAAGLEVMLSALKDGHRSIATFVSQLLYCVLNHHTSQPLAFLPALDASADASLAALASAFGPFQLAELFALPSVQAALSNGAARRDAASRANLATGPCAEAAERMQALLPEWLAGQQLARRHRRTALLCVLELASCLFPGANREVTSARAVYSEIVSARPARQWKSTVQALTKLHQLGSQDCVRLRAALQRCREHLRADAGAAPARAGASLEVLLCPAPAPAPAAGASAESTAPAPVGVFAAPRGWSASKQRRMILASAAAGRADGSGAQHTGLNGGAAAWFEAELCALIDAPGALPLNELWHHDAREADLLAAAWSPTPTHVLQAAMQSVLDSGSAKRGRPASAPSRVAGASVGERWKRARLPAKDRMVAQALAAGGAGRGACGEADDAPPADGRSRRAQAHTLASSAGATNEGTLPSAGGQLVPVGGPLTSRSPQDGWAAAVLSDVLRSTEDKAVGALQAFEAFEAHGLARRASESLGLERGELAAHFVLAAQDLATVGWIKLGSKASRGVLHKLAL